MIPPLLSKRFHRLSSQKHSKSELNDMSSKNQMDLTPDSIPMSRHLERVAMVQLIWDQTAVARVAVNCSPFTTKVKWRNHEWDAMITQKCSVEITE
jgi:hypothetical protein